MTDTSERWRDKIQGYELLRTLRDHAGWQLLKRDMEAKMASIRSQLCDLTCSPERTQHLRIELQYLSTLAKSADITDEQLANARERLAFCQQQEKMRAQYGDVPAETQE